VAEMEQSGRTWFHSHHHASRNVCVCVCVCRSKLSLRKLHYDTTGPGLTYFDNKVVIIRFCLNKRKQLTECTNTEMVIRECLILRMTMNKESIADIRSTNTIRSWLQMKRNKPTKSTINSYINLLLINHSNMFRPLNRSHYQGVQNPWGLQGHWWRSAGMLLCRFVFVVVWMLWNAYTV
jgi:hypothetical protein